VEVFAHAYQNFALNIFPILVKAIDLFRFSGCWFFCFGICFTRPKIFMDISKNKFPHQLLVTEPVRFLNYRTS